MISKLDFAALMKEDEEEEGEDQSTEEVTILKETSGNQTDSKQEAVSARKFFQNVYEKVK